MTENCHKKFPRNLDENHLQPKELREISFIRSLWDYVISQILLLCTCCISAHSKRQEYFLG
jgi:hypothetical protein